MRSTPNLTLMSKWLLLPCLAIAPFFLLSWTSVSVDPKNKLKQAIFSEGIDKPISTPTSLATWKPIAKDIVAPIGIATTSVYPDRLFVLSQPGQIYTISASGKEDQKPRLVADLADKIKSPNAGYDECGLLGMAFHPRFKTNGKVYLHYSRPGKAAGRNHISAIVLHQMSADGTLSATGTDILTVDQPEGNHNGGALEFGPDGYLYIGLGDGGGQGDKHGTIGNSQDLGVLLGKVLRINIDKKGDGTEYSIPSDNPFVTDPAARPEIWAYGFRNPWRFSFDKKTGALFVGDVGQNEFEEVSIVTKGGNYGWRIMEGNHCYNPKADCQTMATNLQPPIDEYPHSTGVSVTGGYVYRGKAIPALTGHYVYGDWIGKLFDLAPNPDGKGWTHSAFSPSAMPQLEELRVNAFGQDIAGELYLCAQNQTGPQRQSGVIYKLVPAK